MRRNSEWRKIERVRRIAGAIAAAIAAVCFSFAMMPVEACSIPVYEWAMVNWEADDYVLHVYHDAPLDADAVGLVESGRPAHGGDLTEPSANLVMRAIDSDAAAAGQEAPAAPWLALRFPEAARVPIDLWTAPFNADEVRALLDSPVRGEAARRLKRGACAVWLLLLSGDADKDAAAGERLRAELRRSAATVETMPPDWKNAESADTAFPVIEVRRDDPAERVTVAMLLATESDLNEYDEPIVFPVYGRGRVPYALVGAGINAANVSEACAFITGECSCIVKDLNPGMDLLMTAAWGTAVQVTSATSTAEARPAPPTPAIPEPGPASFPFRVALPALGAAFVVIVAATLLIARRKAAR